MADRVEIECPCCATRLVIDAETSEILSETRPKRDVDKTFRSAMNDVQSGAGKREQAFSKAFDRTRKLDDLLDKKFEEARKKAKDEPDKKPPSPFDLD
jgi:hypothetical protein